MDYRYEETISWIIPGFYLLFSGVCMVWIMGFIDTTSILSKSKDYKDFVDSIATVLLFLIPVMAFILGWSVNAIGGYLLRIDSLFHHPVTKAYYKVNKTALPSVKKGNLDYREIMNIFDQAKYHINLGGVDRFYYRYVASRNMFTAQLLMLVIIPILFFFTDKYSTSTILLISSLLVLVLFYWVMYRDLNTHARYVFVEDQKIKKSKKQVILKEFRN